MSVFHVHAHAMLITNNAAMQQHQPVVKLRTLAALPKHLAILFRGSLDPVRVLYFCPARVEDVRQGGSHHSSLE
jgi:hypothetical protein